MKGVGVSGYPYRLQALWTVLLAVAWLSLCSPWSWGWNVALGVLAIGAAGLAVLVLGRRQRAQREAMAPMLAAVDASLTELPPGIKRHTPLVLTVGDAYAMTSAWGGDDRVRVSEAAIWVRCDAPAALPHLADALKRWRGGQGPDAVVYLMAADLGRADAPVPVALKPWHVAILGASRALGYALPVGVAVYALSTDRAAETCPWFGVSGASALDMATVPALLLPRLQQYGRLAQSGPPEIPARRAALLDALAQWASATLSALQRTELSPLKITAFGITLVPGMPAPQAPFGQFLAQRTGLSGRGADRAGIQARYPLPAALLRGISPQPVQRTLAQALTHAFAALALFVCAGTAASAWQNRAFAQRIAAHLARYEAIPAAHDAARVDALNAIKRDRDQLARYAAAGVPPRLAFGLYRGAGWLPGLNRVIASYQPPPPPLSMIELDSLSLFASGSAVLNPSATRSLIGALAMIEAHPDKRVLVAGYTDSAGAPPANLKLSLARAAAVRDWLVGASGLSSTRFAIQGYGDTHPKASNATEAGRAANRRVTITLLPECSEAASSSTTQGLAACS